MHVNVKYVAAGILLHSAIGAPSIAFAGCDLSFPPPNNSVMTVKNLTYEIAPDGEVEQLDLITPTQVSNPPLIVQIHGGAFLAGDKSSFLPEAVVLANNGFAVANLNYRLTTTTANQFPAAVQDVRCAVQWLRSQAAVYGFSGGKMGAIGYSAGGNLAAMLGTASAAGGTLDSPSCAASQYSPGVHAVASYYGLYDWTITTSSAPYLGGLPTDNPLSVPASPISYISSSSPPFILARGADDQVIPIEQQDDMAASLQSNGVSVQPFDIEGLGHGFNPFSAASSPAANPSACAVMAMFAANLN